MSATRLPQAKGAASQTAYRIAVTLAALLVYRLGNHIPLPGLDDRALEAAFWNSPLLDRSGIGRLSIFALGVMPYFSALLLSEALLLNASLRNWHGARPENRAALARFVTGLALVLAALQGLGIAFGLEEMQRAVAEPGWMFRTGVVVSLIAATAFLIWLADAVTKWGLGSGFWLLLAATTVAGLCDMANTVWMASTLDAYRGPRDLQRIALYIAVAVLLIVVMARMQPSSARNGQMLWPPILAYTAVTWLHVPLIFLMDRQSPDYVDLLRPGHPCNVLAFALLLPIIVLVRARSLWRASAAPADGPTFRRTPEFHRALVAAMGLLLITLAGELVLATTTLPFSLDGQLIILLVLVSLGMLTASGVVSADQG